MVGFHSFRIKCTILNEEPHINFHWYTLGDSDLSSSANGKPSHFAGKLDLEREAVFKAEVLRRFIYEGYQWLSFFSEST